MLNQLKKIWVKHHNKLIVATTIFFILIGLINFIFIFEVTAQSNDECLWVMNKIAKDSLTITFNNVKENGVTWQAGIRDGDELLSIDGIRTRTTAIASKILDRVQSGDYATYTVKQNGKIFETRVLVKKLINFNGLAFALLSFLWVIVGFIVVTAKSEGKAQLLFYRTGLAVLLFSTIDLLYRGNAVENPIFDNVIVLLGVDTIWTLGGCILPFVLIKFFCTFPNENNLNKKRWFNRTLLCTPALMFLTVTCLKVFFVYNGYSDGLYNVIVNVIQYLIIAGFIGGLVLLFISYTQLKTKRERNSIFVILIAYLVGVIALLYTYILASSIAGIIFNNPYYFTPIILIALLPIAFGYSIFRYSLMDVSEVVRTTVFYGFATVSLAAIYFFVIYVIGQSISSAIGTEYQGIIAGAVFVFSAVVFQSTKDRFQNFITQKFYPEQFVFQTGLLKYSNDVASIVGLNNIYDSTDHLFVDSLKIKTYGLMIKDKSGVFKLVRWHNVSNIKWSFKDEGDNLTGYFMELNSIGKRLILERQDFEKILEQKSSFYIDENIYTIVPLLVKQHLIGLLLFGLKHSGSQFSGKDLDLLSAVANQTAISIDNARLYESETEKKKLERDLENARKIQETLLPKSFPQIKGLELAGKMIPAMHVGGDYFDLIKVSDSKLFVIVGDVSGKGLSASFYMSKLQTMIRLYCNASISPKEVLVEVNNRISENIERNWFITVTLALFDLEKRTVTFCRAGHTTLLRLSNNKLKSFQPGGMGVGLDRGETFNSSLEEVTLDIKNNDLFFFYSDGITEAMNAGNELFGTERIEKILVENNSKSVSEIQESMLNSINEFCAETPQYDDITLVTVRCQL
jgi:serine phosphatase RsbU (regulator of sigma subunit)